MEALPVSTLAALSCGLPAHSRSMRKVTGEKLTLEQTLLAAILDRLSVLCWLNSDDARRGRNRPKSILSELMKEENDEDKPQTFADGASLMAALDKLREGGS